VVHWWCNAKSNVDNIERVANVPILVMEGAGADASDLPNIEIGPYRVVGVPEGNRQGARHGTTSR